MVRRSPAHTRVHHLSVPDWVLALSPQRRAVPHYRNDGGGVTYFLADGTYVKAQVSGPEWDVGRVRARLLWARQFVPAPLPLRSGRNDGLDWLETQGLPGCSATDPRWTSQPEVAVPALGRALRALHDTLPVAQCPFSWSVEQRVALFQVDRRFITDAPVADLVVCHGDACNPNFLLQDDAQCSGYIDLGDLGVGDRWADLAPALQSLSWNFGQGWEETFLTAYGVERDESRLSFYTDLWNAES